MSETDPPFIDRLSAIAGGYDVLLCDVWGVIHNGVVSFPEAAEALGRFRHGGGRVVLITNAPRPSAVVERQLDGLAVPRSAYDSIVSSGDVTREVVAARGGQRVFHLGPARDRPIFDGLPVRFAPAEEADYVVCSGLFDDETETPDDYSGLLSQLRERGLFMVCANPDVVVERGDRLLFCAGALADRYAQAGGEVLYAGKPHAPIYQMALARAQAARGSAAAPRVLAIGDSVRTDLAGAARFGVDMLFITAGIHAEELGTRGRPGAESLARMFAGSEGRPRAVAAKLVW